MPGGQLVGQLVAVEQVAFVARVWLVAVTVLALIALALIALALIALALIALVGPVKKLVGEIVLTALARLPVRIVMALPRFVVSIRVWVLGEFSEQ